VAIGSSTASAQRAPGARIDDKLVANLIHEHPETGRARGSPHPDLTATPDGCRRRASTAIAASACQRERPVTGNIHGDCDRLLMAEMSWSTWAAKLAISTLTRRFGSSIAAIEYHRTCHSSRAASRSRSVP
jgi:hypothetical protein